MSNLEKLPAETRTSLHWNKIDYLQAPLKPNVHMKKNFLFCFLLFFVVDVLVLVVLFLFLVVFLFPYVVPFLSKVDCTNASESWKWFEWEMSRQTSNAVPRNCRARLARGEHSYAMMCVCGMAFAAVRKIPQCRFGAGTCETSTVALDVVRCGTLRRVWSIEL